jgi:predicted ferric reductase
MTNIWQVPHLVAPVRDGGWALLNKLYADEQRELSGTPLYFTTFGLAFLSMPWMRRRFYEAFKYVHIFLGVSYVALLWWHIWREYTSVSILLTLHQTNTDPFFQPYYIYATVSVLLFSNIIRIIHRHHNLRSFSNLNGFPTTLTHLHGNTTRIAIEVPKSLRWKPGQHAFLRMPSISAIGNHPFLIANIPSSEENRSVHEMVFLIRRHNGFTKRLFEREQRPVGDVYLHKRVYSDGLGRPPVINTGQSRVVELGKGKAVKREKSAERIEDIDAIAAIGVTRERSH